MADFNNKFTSGFVVSGQNIGIQAAKITTATEGVTAAFGTDNNAIPTVGAVKDALTTGDLKVASAISADNAAMLGGQLPTYYATSESVTTLAGRVDAAENDITTLESYFTNGAAKSAASATIAAAATSAAEADALKTSRTISFTGDDVTGQFSFDGSSNVETNLTVAAAGELTPSAGSTTTGFAKAAEVEKALAKVTAIGGFEVVDELPPAKDADSKKIYLIKDETAVGDDKYEEWICTDGATWTQIGDTSMDLTNYVQKSDTDYTTAIARAADWAATSATVATTVTEVGALKAASGDWDDAASWVSTNSAGAEAAATWVSTNGAGVLTSAHAGAAASAWIADNKDSLLTAVNVTGSVTGNGTSTYPIGLIASAENALTAVAGKLDTASAAATYLTKNDAASTYATKTAFDTLNDTVNNSTSGLVTKVAANTTAIEQNAEDIEAVSGAVSGMKYYSKVAVKTTTGATVAVTEAGSANDTIGLYAGTGITLATSNDGGKPVVTINANAGEGVDVVGSGAVTVATATVSNVKTFTVNKTADYYDETDGLIHLF